MCFCLDMEKEATIKDWIVCTVIIAVVLWAPLTRFYSSPSNASAPIVTASPAPPNVSLPSPVSEPTTGDRYRALLSTPVTSDTAEASLGGVGRDDDDDTGYGGGYGYSGSTFDGRQKTVHVRSYTRRDGTYVHSYYRRPASRR